MYILANKLKVALKQFVDDFAIHAVEQALLARIEELFTPGSIFELEGELIAGIAGETKESQIERESSEAKLRMSRDALETLKRLDRSHIRVCLPPPRFDIRRQTDLGKQT